MNGNRMRCIVTGGSQGIGQAIVETLLDAGALVAVIDRQEPAADDRDQVAFAACDVTDTAAMAEAAKSLEAELGGPIDTVVANAGMCVSGRLADDPVDALAKHFQVNTIGVMNTFQPHIDTMRSRGEGSLIAVTSNCAHKPRRDLGAYCASKAATKMLIECLALELSVDAIRVNAVAPGSCDTEMQRRQWAELGVPSDRQVVGDLASYRSGIPAGRLAQPRDIAEAVRFLASPASEFMRGVTLTVDGAQSL